MQCQSYTSNHKHNFSVSVKMSTFRPRRYDLTTQQTNPVFWPNLFQDLFHTLYGSVSDLWPRCWQLGVFFLKWWMPWKVSKILGSVLSEQIGVGSNSAAPIHCTNFLSYFCSLHKERSRIDHFEEQTECFQCQLLFFRVHASVLCS